MINVIKAGGQAEPFSDEKFLRSLQAAGLTAQAAREVLAAIKPQLYPGIPTQKIYQLAFRGMRQQGRYLAARYSAKQALLRLGPDGYAFEKFVAAIFQAQGFSTATNRIIAGKFVPHEIDVVARSDDKVLFIECKFHQRAGLKCDVKVPLYIRGRWLDIEQGRQAQDLSAFYLVTNTRFTSEAVRYGQGVGIHLLSWDFPHRRGLKDLISQYHLHPVTCLTSLTGRIKEELLKQGIVLCSDLQKNLRLLMRLDLKRRSLYQIEKELSEL